MHAVRVLPSLSISPYTEPLLASQQTANPNTLIEHATLGALKTLRRLATLGASRQSINRVTARILNSFEEGRIQAKAFHGVQELTTLGRYAKYWSGLIVFLLHAIDNGSGGPFSSYYFDSNPRLQEIVQRVNDRLDALLAMDLKDIEFDKLFSMENEGSDNEEDIPIAVRLHAKALHTAVERLSFFLVRFEFEESSFVSPVVGYMALRTLESNGSWIPAHNFTSIISSMIHCMQLWLLGYCYQAKASAAPLDTLQTIVREQCKRFLVIRHRHHWPSFHTGGCYPACARHPRLNYEIWGGAPQGGGPTGGWNDEIPGGLNDEPRPRCTRDIVRSNDGARRALSNAPVAFLISHVVGVEGAGEDVAGGF